MGEILLALRLKIRILIYFASKIWIATFTASFCLWYYLDFDIHTKFRMAFSFLLLIKILTDLAIFSLFNLNLG
jgi:hypothetical protein